MTNRGRQLILALAVAASAALAGCTMYGYGRTGGYVGVTVAPPAPRSYYYGDYRAGHVYVDGRWAWGASGWYWIDGYWMAERPGQVWVDGYWDNRGGRYLWVDGGWHRNRPGYVYARGYYHGNRCTPGRWQPARAGHSWQPGHYRRSGGGHTWVNGSWTPSSTGRGSPGVIRRDHRSRPPARTYERVPSRRGGR